MNDKLANDLIRYAELVEDGALISPEEMNCASVMRLAAEYLAQPAVAEQHKQRSVSEHLEPVAWLSQGGDVSRSKRYLEEKGFKNLKPLVLQIEDGLGDVETITVYTTPYVATPRPQRKPLTVHEIAEFVGTHEYGSEQLKWFRLGEAAHGIKE